MKCTNCGSNLIEGAAFCENCGTKVQNINDVNVGINNQMPMQSNITQPMNNQMPMQSNMTQPINNQMPMQSNMTQPMNNQMPMQNNMNVQMSNSNKNNKVVFIILGIVAALVVVGVACFLILGKGKNVDVDAMMKEATNHLKGVDNYRMDLAANIGFEAEGVSISMDIDADLEVDEKNGKSKTVMTMSFFGMEMDMTSYSEKDGDKYITYTQESSDSDVWTKTVSENSSFEEGINGISDAVLDATSFEKVKSDEKGLTKIKVTVDSKKLQFLLSDVDTSEFSEEELQLNDKLIMYFYIDKNNHYSKIYIDLLENIDLSSIEEEMTVSEFSIEISLSDYNKVGEIRIPSDVKENAVEETEDDYDSYDEVDYTYYEADDYMDEIIYSAENYCYSQDDFGGSEIDFSKYNNELDLDFTAPTSGILYIDTDCNVTVKNNVIIDGKSCTYSDYTSTCN